MRENARSFRQRNTISKLLWLNYVVANGASAEQIYHYVDVWSSSGPVTKNGVMRMWALWMSNAAMAAGVVITLSAAMAALRWAGKTGNFENEKQALDSQETWARAAEIQQEIDAGQ